MPEVPEYSNKVLIFGGSESGKTIAWLNKIKIKDNQSDQNFFM